MHSFEKAKKIADQINSSKQNSFEINIGELNHPDEFEPLLRSLVKEGVELVINKLPLKVRCSSCGFIGEIDAPDSPVPIKIICPICSSYVELTSGDELILKPVDRQKNKENNQA